MAVHGARLMLAFAGPVGASEAQTRRLQALARSPLRAHATPRSRSQLRKRDRRRASRMDTAMRRASCPTRRCSRKRLAMTGKTWTRRPIRHGHARADRSCVAGAAVLQGRAAPAGAARRPVRRRRACRTWWSASSSSGASTSSPPSSPTRSSCSCAACARACRSPRRSASSRSEVPGPVGEEFRSVTDKMKIGRTMDDALQETADRLGTPEFQFFCITLAIQRETGGNLAETLANLADVLRKRAQMKLKIKAMSLGIEGVGLYRRLAAVHRVRHDLVDQPRLHGELLHRRAPDRRRPRRHGVDGASAPSSWPR